MSTPEKKSICRNRRARFEYAIEETFEAGIALVGSEVKSLRAGQASLTEAYGRLRDGQVLLCQAHIAPYDPASRENHAPERERRLLLHRREIDRISGRVRERGLALVPLEMYWKDGRAKLALALARGKKRYDKRRDIADRDSERRLRRVVKRRQRGP